MVIQERINLRGQLKLLRDPRLKKPIPWDRWGTGRAKSIHELAREIRKGETTLSITSKGRLRRTVKRSQIRVIYKNLEYVEVRQEYMAENGTVQRIRPRNHRYISEKSLPDERPIDTALRCLDQEAGLKDVEPPRLIETGPVTIKRDKSKTYPGLKDNMKTQTYVIFLRDEEAKERMHGYREVQHRKVVLYEMRPQE